MQDLLQGVQPAIRFHVRQSQWSEEKTQVVDETTVALMVNGAHYVTVALTPIDLQAWVVGFLAGEGVIRQPQDLTIFRWYPEEGQLWVRVPGYRRDPNSHARYLGSCCGQSRPAFLERAENVLVHSEIAVTPQQLQRGFAALNAWSQTQRSGGLHVAGLADRSGQLVLTSADVGRHNALDKVFGQGLCRPEFSLSDHIVLFSGRLSAEIIAKVARMGCAIVASNAAPTSLGIKLAGQLGITAVAFLRQEELSIFSHVERVQCPGDGVWEMKERG